MKFEPKTETQVSRLLEEGVYKFKVTDANEGKSQAGNPQMAIIITCYCDSGKVAQVRDYLLTDNPNFAFKLRHFCYSIGLEEQYEKGEITAKMIIGREGLAKVRIEKDKKGVHQDKNSISDYVMQATPTINAPASPTVVNTPISNLAVARSASLSAPADVLNDDVPF